MQPDVGSPRFRVGRRRAVSFDVIRLLLGPEDPEARRVADDAPLRRARLPGEGFRIHGQMQRSGDAGPDLGDNDLDSDCLRSRAASAALETTLRGVWFILPREKGQSYGVEEADDRKSEEGIPPIIRDSDE